MRKLAAALFIVFLLAVAYWADTDTMPPVLQAVELLPSGDRIGHFVLYGILAFLLNGAFSARGVRLGTASVQAGSLLAAVAALLEELSQFLFPSRTPDPVDLLFGWLGILVADWLFKRTWRPPVPVSAGRAVADQDQAAPPE